MSLKFGRRFFMGATTAALAVGSIARPSANATAGMPRRFVFFLSGNGMDATMLMSSAVKSFIATSRGAPVRDDLWWGEGYGNDRGYGATHTSAQSFDGLASATGLASIGDLEPQACVVLGLSQVGVTGGHSAYHGVLSATRTIRSDPGGQSIDDYLSLVDDVRGIGMAATPIPALRLGVTSAGTSVAFDSCAAGRGRALPMLLSPTAAWDAYIRPLVDPTATATLDRRTRLLEFALSDAMRASATAPAGLAHAQASHYADAADALLRNQGRLAQVIAASAGAMLPTRPADTLGPLDAMRAQMGMIGAALRTGLTNVAVMGMGPGDGFDGLAYRVGPNTANGRHGLCHQYAAETAADIRTELRIAWKQEIDSVLTLARELRDTPEPGGGGTMLDHTMIAYMPDNGVGHHSHNDDHPFLLVGGTGLGLHTGGRTVIYPDYASNSASRRQISNLWNTVGGVLAGGTLDAFGNPQGRFATGPLMELIS